MRAWFELADGAPSAQPAVAGSSRSRSRSTMAELPGIGAGPISGPRQSS